MNCVRRGGELGLCDFDWRRMNEPCRKMLQGNSLRRTSQNSRDLASGLKRVRFAQFFQFPTVFKPAGKETKVGNDCHNLCRPFFVFSPVFSRVKRVFPTWWELSFESLFLITHQRSKDPLGDKIADSLVSLTSGLSDFFAPRDSLNSLPQSRFCQLKMKWLPKVEDDFVDTPEIRFGPVR